MPFAESCWRKPVSRKLSLKEALGRLGKTQAKDRDRSASLRSVKAILTPGKINQPVELARALRRHGMSLRKAHETLNRLTAGQEVAVALHAGDSRKFASELSALGTQAHFIKAPTAVNVKKIRTKFGISQSEFALRFGLELDTIQNWEQRRYGVPDPVAVMLLKIIEECPQVVEAVLTKRSIAELLASRSAVSPKHFPAEVVARGARQPSATALSREGSTVSLTYKLPSIVPPWIVALTSKAEKRTR
jgi:DNA-binding transcriptional regulator YiaG